MSYSLTVYTCRTTELQGGTDSITAMNGWTETNISYEEKGSISSEKKTAKTSTNNSKVPKLPACCVQNVAPTFYVDTSNGADMIAKALTGLGWKQTKDKKDVKFKMKWVEMTSMINFDILKEGQQMVNHIPNSYILTNKLGLLNSLKDYERVTLSVKGRFPRLLMSEFLPDTYKLDEQQDTEMFLQTYNDCDIWIYKPEGYNQGVGIHLLRSRDEVNKLLQERQTKKAALRPGRQLHRIIVQRYIMNPLLVKERKFDVRVYMLVASTTPFLVLYHTGYIRLSCNKYDENDKNMCVHLTNQSVQKRDPNYEKMLEDTAWSMDRFNQYVNSVVRHDSHVMIEQDWVYRSFTKQMQEIMIHCFNSVKHKLHRKLGYFDLFGLDFMVDTDMKVWLIEINSNPSICGKVSCQTEVNTSMINETLNIVIECFDKSRKNKPLMPLKSLKHFSVLYRGKGTGD